MLCRICRGNLMHDMCTPSRSRSLLSQAGTPAFAVPWRRFAARRGCASAGANSRSDTARSSKTRSGARRRRRYKTRRTSSTVRTRTGGVPRVPEGWKVPPPWTCYDQFTDSSSCLGRRSPTSSAGWCTRKISVDRLRRRRPLCIRWSWRPMPTIGRAMLTSRRPSMRWEPIRMPEAFGDTRNRPGGQPSIYLRAGSPLLN